MNRLYKELDRILWSIRPRFYLCRDVIVVRWMKYEWLIKRRHML